MLDPDVRPELMGIVTIFPSEVESEWFNCNSQSEGRCSIIIPSSTLLPPPPPLDTLSNTPASWKPVLLGINVFDLCTLLWFTGARGPPGTALRGEAMFVCSPPPAPTADEFGLAGVDNLVLTPPFNPDVDFVKRRRPLVIGDENPPPEGEEGDNEEDIKFDNPNPRVGRFADERDAFRPRVAKNPPEDEFDDRDATAGCLMVGERGIVIIELEGVEE